MTPEKPACMVCGNYLIGRTCFAFPKEIPNKVWLEGDKHDKPIEGDNGIQFEPIEKE